MTNKYVVMQRLYQPNVQLSEFNVYDSTRPFNVNLMREPTENTSKMITAFGSFNEVMMSSSFVHFKIYQKRNCFFRLIRPSTVNLLMYRFGFGCCLFTTKNPSCLTLRIVVKPLIQVKGLSFTYNRIRILFGKLFSIEFVCCNEHIGKRHICLL